MRSKTIVVALSWCDGVSVIFLFSYESCQKEKNAQIKMCFEEELENPHVSFRRKSSEV